MTKLVECVPNFSEGRRLDVVDALASAVRSTPRVHLLDVTSDPDHNRSVLTFAGPPDAVATAMEAAVPVALEQIDMERHEGQHPRIGAVDVVPFVPLGDTTMDECVELARRFGERIARRFDLPVYLYARAAMRPDRVVLNDIRRPQYEGLKREIALPGRAPDFGPARMHPRGGATVVGARPFLIAWNVDLDTRDVEVAKEIARAIRESSGGLPRVQAKGFLLAEEGRSQVSMNLLDFAVTPLWRVWEEADALASARGVALHDSELIGLAPLAAFTDVADHIGVPPDLALEERAVAGAAWLRMRDFEPTMALELRLAAATRRPAGG